MKDTVKELQKKIHNLHIALNKKVAKNKNQKEQITLLLKQKEELQEENNFVKSEHNKIIEKLNNSILETTISEGIRYNLEKKIKEKDTIISYLEGKLK